MSFWDLTFYVPLAIAPLSCGAVQLLLMKAGRRYDLGAVLYVALGSFLVVTFSDAVGSVHAWRVVIPLLIVVSASAFLRVLVLSYSQPVLFTLVALAQLWIAVPLVNHSMAQIGLHGISIGQQIPNSIAFAAAIAIVTLSLAAIYTMRLHSRMDAFTQSPEAYSVLIGSRLALGVQVEALALANYVSAGVLVGLTMEDISSQHFGMEAIWILLGVSAAPRFSWYLALAFPLAVVILRFTINAVAPPRFSVHITYLVLATALAATAFGSVGKRIRRA